MLRYCKKGKKKGAGNRRLILESEDVHRHRHVADPSLAASRLCCSLSKEWILEEVGTANMDREGSGESELGVLTQALRSHGLPFDSASLQHAFRDAEQGPALTEWVNTYLMSDTLLSLDELGL